MESKGLSFASPPQQTCWLVEYWSCRFCEKYNRDKHDIQRHIEVVPATVPVSLQPLTTKWPPLQGKWAVMCGSVWTVESVPTKGQI